MDIAAIGRQFGLNEAQTRAAMDALAPVIAAGMRRSTEDPSSMQDLLSLVLAGGYDRSLADESSLQLERTKLRGDGVLGQIFGDDKDISREVAQRLSASTGIGAAVLKKLLPVLATVVAGWLAKRMASGSPAGAGTSSGDAIGTPQSTGNDRGLGEVVRDVLREGQSGQTPPSRPTQVPPGSGSGTSLEDILGDILGGGQNGRVIVKQIPPDQMGQILKDIFGGNIPGGSSVDVPRHQPSEDALNRGRKTFDDVLGGNTRTGNAADDLLNSSRDRSEAADRRLGRRRARRLAQRPVPGTLGPSQSWLSLQIQPRAGRTRRSRASL